MKKYLLLMLISFLTLMLFSCQKSTDESVVSDTSTNNEKSKTWEFYNSLHTESFYITFEMIISDGTQASVAQAVGGDNVTTIIDYNDKSANDIYELHTANKTYSLNILKKEYIVLDTSQYSNLFSSFDYEIYATADSVSVMNFKSISYNCEAFEFGNFITRFYFNSESESLYAIESLESGIIKQTIQNIQVSDKIPDNVILIKPDDYTDATFVITDELSWPSGWND